MSILKKLVLILIMFAIFCLGRVLGIYEQQKVNSNLINKLYIELDDKEEQNRILKEENKKLNNILEGY